MAFLTDFFIGLIQHLSEGSHGSNCEHGCDIPSAIGYPHANNLSRYSVGETTEIRVHKSNREADTPI